MYYHEADISIHASRRYGYDMNNNLVYQGYALPGAEDTDSLWMIIKHEYDANNNLIASKCVEGTVAYTYKWDERENYTYI